MLQPRLVILPAAGEVRPDGDDHGDIHVQHLCYAFPQHTVLHSPLCAEAVSAAHEEKVHPADKAQPVYAEGRRHREKAAAQRAQYPVVAFKRNGPYRGGSFKQV